MPINPIPEKQSNGIYKYGATLLSIKMAIKNVTYAENKVIQPNADIWFFLTVITSIPVKVQMTDARFKKRDVPMANHRLSISFGFAAACEYTRLNLIYTFQKEAKLWVAAK